MLKARATEAQNLAILLSDLIYQRYELVENLADGEEGRDQLVYEIGRLEALLDQLHGIADDSGQPVVVMALRDTLETTVH